MWFHFSSLQLVLLTHKNILKVFSSLAGGSGPVKSDR